MFSNLIKNEALDSNWLIVVCCNWNGLSWNLMDPSKLKWTVTLRVGLDEGSSKMRYGVNILCLIFSRLL